MYDLVQVQSYMQILNLASMTVIQCLTSDSGTIQKQETQVVRDDVMWSEKILPDLNCFVMALHEFQKDTMLQDKFYQTPDSKKSYIVTSLLNKARKMLFPDMILKRSKKQVGVGEESKNMGALTSGGSTQCGDVSIVEKPKTVRKKKMVGTGSEVGQGLVSEAGFIGGSIQPALTPGARKTTGQPSRPRKRQKVEKSEKSEKITSHLA